MHNEAQYPSGRQPALTRLGPSARRFLWNILFVHTHVRGPKSVYFSSLAINPRNSLSALLGASIFWNILFPKQRLRLIPQTTLAFRGSYLVSKACSTETAKQRPQTDAGHPRTIRGPSGRGVPSLPAWCAKPACLLENQWKPMENQWKLIENQWKPMENKRKPMKFNENQWKPMKTKENQWQPMENKWQPRLTENIVWGPRAGIIVSLGQDNLCFC